MAIDWSTFNSFVASHQRFLLMTHVKPDCDGIGSELGMAETLRSVGKSARIAIVGNMPQRYAFIDPDREVESFRANDDFRNTDAVIVLDTGTWNQLGEFGSFLRELPAPRIVIDHHRTQDDLGGSALVDVQAEATARLVVEACDAIGGTLSTKAAHALFTALATDTGWFRHPNATAPTFALAERLIRLGAIPHKIYESLYDQNSLPRLRLMGLVLSRMEIAGEGRIAFSEVYLKDFAATGAGPGDTEDLVNYPRSLAGAEIAALLTEQPQGFVRVSLRCREGLDVGKVAESFGGGGHRLAAGCSIAGTVSDARGKLIHALLPLVAR